MTHILPPSLLLPEPAETLDTRMPEDHRAEPGVGS